MSSSKLNGQAVKPEERHGFEFGGPLGAFGISFGLPLLTYLMTFLCNDISGCPVPAVLHPSSLTLDKLKTDIGWPANGIWGLTNLKVTGVVLGYYLLSMILHRVLPGEVAEGVPLTTGGRLKYKFNTFSSSVLIVVACLAGTIAQGADFPVWTFIWENQLQILTTNILISYALATYVYIKSFGVKPGNKENRELAAGGHSGNMLYDWFIGRELNPRVIIPLLGEIDIKIFCEMRPGMLGWLLFDYAFIAHQYKTYGVVTDSILLITIFQTLYVFDAYYMEPAILTTIDITTDGFGFMLAFGDLVWLPFTYSVQTRYLAVYPLHLGILGTAGVLAPLAVGYYIFRSTNNEKNRFRTDPSDPRIAHLKYIETKSGGKLLVSGWWGRARHINYLGDWIQSWSYVLPTGFAGYVIQYTSSAPTDGQSLADGSFVGGQPFGAQVVQAEAKGWGMVITYFYIVYFAVLLIHRERRDDDKCLRKYGEDWKKYKKLVPYRIVPGIY